MLIKDTWIEFELAEGLEHLNDLIRDIECDSLINDGDLQIQVAHLYWHLNHAWNTRSYRRSELDKLPIDDQSAIGRPYPSDLGLAKGRTPLRPRRLPPKRLLSGLRWLRMKWEDIVRVIAQNDRARVDDIVQGVYELYTILNVTWNRGGRVSLIPCEQSGYDKLKYNVFPIDLEDLN